MLSTWSRKSVPGGRPVRIAEPGAELAVSPDPEWKGCSRPTVALLQGCGYVLIRPQHSDVRPLLRRITLGGIRRQLGRPSSTDPDDSIRMPLVERRHSLSRVLP